MINYKHLRYFWVAARQGGIARASELLHLTPQTISGQINLLEEQLGEALFSRSGRNLELTETGKLVLSYAEEIFSLGSEMEEAVRGQPSGKSMVFKVGVADVVPKSIAYRLLAPATDLSSLFRIVCRESDLTSLLGELAVHRLDMVLADAPVPAGVNVRGYNHRLGDCGVSFFASPGLAKTLAGDFPRCLDAAPLLLPSALSLLQSRLLQWLDGLRIRPRIVGEFDDSALMKVFGQAGTGIFTGPTAIAGEVAKQYGVEIIGAIDEVREEFYAISVERRISHPAVAAITETARAWLK